VGRWTLGASRAKALIGRQRAERCASPLGAANQHGSLPTDRPKVCDRPRPGGSVAPHVRTAIRPKSEGQRIKSKPSAAEGRSRRC